MSFVLIEGRIVNLMAVTRIEFQPDIRIVVMSLVDGDTLTFGGFENGVDRGTPLWDELKKMASSIYNYNRARGA